MKKPVLVGIDVSARPFVVAQEGPGQDVHTEEIPNTEAGHRQRCRCLARPTHPVRVCLEASGIDHLDLALALHRTKPIEVMVANPRSTKDVARARLPRTTTDRTDAHSLLECVRRMSCVAWAPPTTDVLALRACSRRIAALTVIAGQERNRRQAADPCRERPPVLGDKTDAHLAFLQRAASTG